MPTLTPIDHEPAELDLPPTLDGRDGLNRARSGIPQIDADNDIEALRVWLAEYADSPNTQRTYRKEAWRLLLWSTQELHRPLSSLAREDLILYEAFLANPSGSWASAERARHGVHRRLFNKPLSQRSIEQAMVILSGLFDYLVRAGYLVSNPLALRRRRARATPRSQATPRRYLDEDRWNAVLDFIETLPQETHRDRSHYERARWLFSLLYGTAMRAAEAAKASSQDIVQERGKWWLHVVGKGKHAGEVPLSDDLIEDWMRYRRFHGLSALPTSGEEQIPLVLDIHGRRGHFLTPTGLYLIVKEVFRRAAAALEQHDPRGAEQLRKASTHWLRHTAATHQADNGNELRYIQANLRHASLDTTSIYLHVDQDKRHEETVSRMTRRPKP